MKEGSIPDRANRFARRHRDGFISGATGLVAGGILASPVHDPSLLIHLAETVGLGGGSIASFLYASKEYRTNSSRKKYGLPAREVIGSKRLRKFHTSPNESAKLLEEHLGITMDNKPEVILFDIRDSFFNVANLLFWKRKATGWYQPLAHTIFLKNNDKLATSVHENTHAYSYTRNPDFFIGKLQENVHSFTKIQEGRACPEFDVDGYLTCRLFDEGLATWAEMTVMRELKERDTDKKDDKGLFDQSFVCLYDLCFPGEDQYNMDKLLLPNPVIMQEIRGIVTLLSEDMKVPGKGFRKARHRRKYHRIFSENFYYVGVCFVHQVMQSLQAKGMSRAEAFDAMIFNPPTSFDDIAEPSTYIQRLEKDVEA